jgi:tripartite-type tricarboxylate transporter receptor subunit TctC
MAGRNEAPPREQPARTRRAAIRALLVVAAAAALAASPATRGQSAQAWPTKPVRVVIPFSTGGTADILGRIVAQQLSRQLNQPFVVENKPGAGATIGAADVAKPPADGYTLLVVTPTFSITQYVYPNLPYDGQKDFVPVGLLMTTPLVLITNPSTSLRTAADFMQAVKAQPGRMSFSSAGNGSTPHLAMESLRQQVGSLDLLHVPFKGGGEAITAVLAGTTNFYFAAPIEVMQNVKAGKLVILGASSLTRTPGLPDYPTLSETIAPGFEVMHYTSLLVRAGTPRDIIEKLSENLVRALQAPEVREKIAQNGDVPAGTLAEAASLYAREYPRWSSAVKAANVKPD